LHISRETLSYIKAKEQTNQKLRHQLNIHKISGSYIYKKINKPLHPFNPFFLLKNKQQTYFQNKESSVDQACMVKTNLTSGREV